MPAYEVRAVDSRTVVVLATTDTATAALAKWRDGLSRYRRVWVVDATGTDVPIADLQMRSRQERGPEH
jgi:hypothetical protein